MKTLAAFLLLCVVAAHGQRTLYIDTSLPNSHPLKKELVEKLKRPGTVIIVTLPEKAALILELEETGRSLGMCVGGIFFSSACGHRGRALLKSRQTGEELWSEEKGGGWQWSGWSAGAVGKKLGDDLVKFLSKDQEKFSRHFSTDTLAPAQAAPTPEVAAPVPPETPKPAPTATASPAPDHLIKFLKAPTALMPPQATEPASTAPVPASPAPPEVAAPAPPETPRPAPTATASPAPATANEPVKKPAPKCPGGRLWYVSPSGEPICVWTH